MEIRPLSSDFAVSPQIACADAEEIARLGYVKVISNRPDGEEPHQPTSLEMMKSVSRAGIGYLHIPVVGGDISADDVSEMRRALQRASGPVLAFCRSGARSARLWALAVAPHRRTDDILSRAAAAGYDLSALSDAIDAQRNIFVESCNDKT
jgi:sulfide:quinone oxidoreductase